MSAVGKRLSASEPLTEHDVAERLSRAADRLLRILMDVRQAEGDLFEDVKRSRYLPGGLLEGLAAELQAWGVEPRTLRDDVEPRGPTG